MVVHGNDFFAVGPREELTRHPSGSRLGESRAKKRIAESGRLRRVRQGVSRCGRAGPRGQACEDAFLFLHH